jgi:hypothetical protein
MIVLTRPSAVSREFVAQIHTVILSEAKDLCICIRPNA